MQTGPPHCITFLGHHGITGLGVELPLHDWVEVLSSFESCLQTLGDCVST